MFKKFIWVLLLCLMLVWTTAYAKQERITTAKHDVVKVTLDGNHRIVTAALSNSEWVASVKDLMNSAWWVSAINGAFFCPAEAAYSRCTANTSDFMRIENGNLYATYWEDIWAWRSLFWFDYNGRPMMSVRDWSKETRSSNGVRFHEDIPKYEYWISMYTLVYEWIDVSKNSSMASDSKQSQAGDKMFICSTQDRSKVYFGRVKSIPFWDLWSYIKNNFWCYNANLLDGWWSRAMIYNNQYIVWPWRNVKDAFVVVETTPTYDWSHQEEKQEATTNNNSSYDPVAKWRAFWKSLMIAINNSDKTWSECYDYVKLLEDRLYTIETILDDKRTATMVLETRRFLASHDLFYRFNWILHENEWPKTTPESERDVTGRKNW